MKAITTTWLPGGMSLPDRVMARDCDGNRATVSTSESTDDKSAYDLAAIELCKKMGLTGTLIRGVVDNGHVVYVWDDPSCRLEVK